MRCEQDTREVPWGVPPRDAGDAFSVWADGFAVQLAEDSYTVCRVVEPVPTRLTPVAVFYAEGEIYALGFIEGDRLRIADAEDERIVRVGAGPYFLVRHVRYCPEEPSRACAILGDPRTVTGFVDRDPNGPPSGWDYHEESLEGSSALLESTFVANYCGFEVRVRGQDVSACASMPTVTRRIQCLGRLQDGSRMEELWSEEDEQDVETPPAERQTDGAVLFRRGPSEVAVSYTIPLTALTCVSQGRLTYRHGDPMASARTLVWIDGTVPNIEGRIMRVADHEEEQSDCANAWDGLELAPVVGSSGATQNQVVGGALIGLLNPPLFEFGRGYVRDVAIDESLAEQLPDTLVLVEGDLRAGPRVSSIRTP